MLGLNLNVGLVIACLRVRAFLFGEQVHRFCYSKCFKVLNTSFLPKRRRQTAQTQIRLLLKKQSDHGIPCLLFKQAFYEISALKTHILFEHRKRSVRNFRIFTLVPNSDVLAYMLLYCPASQE